MVGKPWMNTMTNPDLGNYKWEYCVQASYYSYWTYEPRIGDLVLSKRKGNSFVGYVEEIFITPQQIGLVVVKMPKKKPTKKDESKL